jgi:hypothetical protein
LLRVGLFTELLPGNTLIKSVTIFIENGTSQHNIIILGSHGGGYEVAGRCSEVPTLKKYLTTNKQRKGG